MTVAIDSSALMDIDQGINASLCTHIGKSMPEWEEELKSISLSLWKRRIDITFHFD